MQTSDEYPLKRLCKEREKLTHLYRSHKGAGLQSLSSDAQRQAYLAARLPATYAAVCKVLEEIKTAEITSLLDVGAGPGTVSLAANHFFPNIEATLIEKDPGFILLGKELTSGKWICQDMTKTPSFPAHDLVVASYCLNEIKETERLKFVQKLWQATQQYLVLIEPGTKLSFESLKKMREYLLSLGGHLVAPCPHSQACPLSPQDWCHFSVRIERSSLHRKIKNATLNYEDEKFSYLIFSKKSTPLCQARILRHPFKGKGFVKLQLCSKEGLASKVVTKKNKPEYIDIKKKKWGETL